MKRRPTTSARRYPRWLGALTLTCALSASSLAHARELPRPEDYRPDQRPAKLLSGSPGGRTATLSNVRWGFVERGTKKDWKPIFQDTTVRTGQVKEVFVMMEPFKPEWIAAHGMLGFEFKRDRPLVGADGKKARGLVLSVEAHLEKNEPYNLINGMKDQFEIVYQMSTMKDIYQKCLVKQGHKLIKHKLRLNQQQKDALLRGTLAAAVKDRSSETYHTTRNSCYQNVQRLINGVVPRRQRVRQWLVRAPLPGGRKVGLYNPMATMPKLGPRALAGKGLVKLADRVVSLPREVMAKQAAARRVRPVHRSFRLTRRAK